MPSGYSLENFVADMTRLVQAQPDEAALLDAGRGYLERLVANPDCVPEQYCVPVGRGDKPNHGTYLLHRGPGLYVTAVVWGPGDSIGPHNHDTWGMIGIARNAIQESRYDRLDGGTGPGPAKLQKRSTALLRQGEVCLLRTGSDEIHSLDNFSDRPTVEVHVYGKELVGLPRVYFDQAKESAIAFKSTHYDN